jgi:hypothetical protein
VATAGHHPLLDQLGSALRSRATSTVLLATVTVAAVLAAVSANGFPANHVTANDGGVWLVNDAPGGGAPGSFGEFNVPIGQLQTAFATPSKTLTGTYNLDVRQQGTLVLAIDIQGGVVYPVDVATGAPDRAGGVTFTAGAEVALGGSVAAILEPATPTAPAKLWAASVGPGPVASLAGLVTTGKPTATLPGGAALAVDSAGDVFVASRRQLLELAVSKEGFAAPRTTTFAEPLSSVGLTTVGTVPVVLNAAEHVVLFPDTGVTTTLPGSANQGPDVVLQQPGPAAKSVLAATSTALYAIPIRGGPPTLLASAPAGVPAAPVRLDGCAYGAWAGSPGQAAQVCTSGPRFEGPLPGGAGSALAQPVFRVNNNEILLNDTADGAAWTVEGRPARVLAGSAWLRVIESLSPNSRHAARHQARSSASSSGRPKLHNPPLFARPGRQSVLHLLDDDSDPRGSILSILGVSPASGPGFSLAITPNAQSVILTLAPGAHAPVTFDYEVVDGFGHTATGPVTVTPSTATSSPTLLAPPLVGSHVVSGATVLMQVLGNWRDRDNDALSLASASVPSGLGELSWTGDGLITYTAPSVATNTAVTITYHVTNGYTRPATSSLHLVVLGRGDLGVYPPIAVPSAVRVLVGKPTVFSPLANDVFGADPSRPSATLSLAGPVAPTTGLGVATNLSTGQLTLTAARAGTFLLSYRAAYGAGLSRPTPILVQAVLPPGTPPAPVTVPTSVTLHGQFATTINVLANDYDPAGGLLTVVSVSTPPSLQATIEQGKFLRIVAVSGDPPPHQVLTYEATNGVTPPVTGQVTALWAPALPPSPPVVTATYATVRAGAEVGVPVLAAASDPDGEAVFLSPGGTPNAVQLAPTNAGTPMAPGGLGAASISGGELRYEAPPGSHLAAPEAITASYLVESQSGEETTGHTYFTIIPDTPAYDAPPDPSQVDARVPAGGTVTIPIPTSGVDPDGDSVTLTGITSPPQLGRILATTANSITYQAYPVTTSAAGRFSGGTDRFTYQVENPSGQTADAVVEVGVTPPVPPEPPVAVDQFATAAPGAEVDVALLQGAITAPGDQVRVLPLSRTDPGASSVAHLTGPSGTDLVAVAPRSAAPLSIAYGLTDGTSTPSLAEVVVRSEPGYRIPPVAADYFPAPPPAGTRTIRVDVLAHDADPGGRPGDLRLVGSTAAGVATAGADLVLPVGSGPRAIPYVVRSTTTGATAVGVVYVPGVSAGPRLRPGKTIQVPEGGSVTVDLSSYVSDPGHPLRVTTTAAAVASPSGGLAARVDSNTAVTLTGARGFVGPGALVVQVIDAASLSAPGAVTATLTIPVQVGKPTPIVRCPTTPLPLTEGGSTEDATITSVCQVWTPPGTDPASVDFTATWVQRPSDVSFAWAPGAVGRTLALLAGSGARGGQAGVLAIGVAGAGAIASTRLPVEVVEAPPASVSAIDVPGVQAGHTATIDLAQYVTSPLAKPDIVAISVTRTSGDPATVSLAGGTVRITPAREARGVTTFALVVSDQGRARPDRYVTGTITVQVLGLPGAPSGLSGVPSNDQVALSWTAAASNGAAVDHYLVSMGGSTRTAVGTSYTWTRLTNGHAYTFTVRAVNPVGTGPASPPVTSSPRSVPAAPSGVVATGGDTQARVVWTAPNDNGQPITGYTVTVSPSPSGGASRQVGGGQTSLTWTGLANAIGPYVFTVVAHNAVGPGPTSAPSNAVYAHGTPATPATPTAAGAVSPDQTTTTITVSWPAIGNCNDAQPCAHYVVTELRNGAPVSSETTGGTCSSGGSLCATFGPIVNDGASYTYTLRATNQQGQTSATSGASSPPIVAAGIPAAVTDLQVAPGNTVANATFTLPAAHGSSISKVNYVATGGASALTGSWASPGSPGQSVTEQIPNLVNGVTYSVTVSACNETGECGALSNVATVDPYGPPYAPSVSATGNGDNITFAWSGGGDNGRPVAAYWVCIDGTCTNEGPNPGSVTNTYGCSQTHSVYAYVVDTVGQTSPDSPTASASTQVCSPPNPPSVTGSVSGNTITWSWSGGGGNTLPISSYVLCVDGSCTNEGANPGSTTDTYGCGQTHSAYAYVVDSIGQQSANSSTVTETTAACPPSISASQGPAGYSSTGSCTSLSDGCYWLAFSVSNFPTGSYSWTCIFNPGPNYSSSPITISSANQSFAGDVGSDTNGWCLYGPGESVAIQIHGVTSNTVTYP